jgi:Ran GTPase-activating protein (RanGAP) involved in mRNA processing and transport
MISSLALSHSTIFDFTQTLTTLNLWNNGIGDQGAKYLSNALKQNTVGQNLILLSLSDPTIFDFIQTLTKLDLARNQIKDQGAQYLSEALLNNKVR